MTPATPPDWDAIARYLSGECTAEEAAEIRAWLDANPGDRELVERLNGAAAVDVAADVDVEAALARVHQRMSDTPRPHLTLDRGGAQSSRSARMVMIGGLVAAAAAAVMFIANRRPAATSQPAAARTVATTVGQRDSVLLADGSRVILGPQSRLEVPVGYGQSTRTVSLTGDAYFDVRHDVAKPFQVRASGALIEDVGTTFTVESDAGEATTVAVVSGSVRLRADRPSSTDVLLAAGDRGSIDQAGQPRAQRHAVRDEDTAWLSGRLAFRDASLARVAAEIERWYGVKILVTDSALRAQHITTSFEGESVDQALRILGLTMGAKIERRGDSAIVSPARGSKTSR